MPARNTSILVGALIVVVVFFLLSVFEVSIPAPAPWVDPWTKFIASVVAIAVALKGYINGFNSLL